MSNDGRLLGIGATGTGVTAICCFTPALIFTLGLLGVSTWVGWLDYVLLPALGLFATITIIAGSRLLWRRKQC